MTAPKLSVDPDILRYFDYEHLPAPLREVSKACADLAHEIGRPPARRARAASRAAQTPGSQGLIRPLPLDIGTVTTATATKGQACADVDRG
jgi:hypothetical protein